MSGVPICGEKDFGPMSAFVQSMPGFRLYLRPYGLAVYACGPSRNSADPVNPSAHDHDHFLVHPSLDTIRGGTVRLVEYSDGRAVPLQVDPG